MFGLHPFGLARVASNACCLPKHEVSLRILFRSIHGGNQHHPNSCAGGNELFIRCFVDIVCFVKKFKPITGFVRFRERNLKLDDKIHFTVGVSCLTNVCAYGCTASSNLVRNNGFSLFPELFDKIDDRDSEVHKPHRKCIISHNTTAMNPL